MPPSLNDSFLVSMLNACCNLNVHNLIRGSLSIGKHILKPRLETRYLMDLVSRDGA